MKQGLEFVDWLLLGLATVLFAFLAQVACALCEIVIRGASVHLEDNGVLQEFCSTECLDKYRQREAMASTERPKLKPQNSIQYQYESSGRCLRDMKACIHRAGEVHGSLTLRKRKARLV